MRLRDLQVLSGKERTRVCSGLWNEAVMEMSPLSKHFFSLILWTCWKKISARIIGQDLISIDKLLGFWRKWNFGGNIAKGNFEMFPLLLGFEREEDYHPVSGFVKPRGRTAEQKYLPPLPGKCDSRKVLFSIFCSAWGFVSGRLIVHQDEIYLSAPRQVLDFCKKEDSVIHRKTKDNLLQFST